MKNVYIGLLVVSMSFVGCATTRVANVETKIEQKAALGNEIIGLDKEGQAIVQKEDPVENELREQRWKNSDLEAVVRTSHESLDRCLVETADPRLGGNGEVSEIPEVDAAMDLSKIKESIGMTEDGSLKVVKKELLTDRIARERKYEQSLNNSAKIISKHRKVCERKMGYARVKAGLPSERFKGEGHFGVGGSYIQTSPSEQTLDDAFKLAKLRGGNAGSTETATTASNE